MSLIEFSGKLDSAPRCIKERGAIRDFSIEGDQIKLVKHGAVRRKTPSKLSYWSTKAGRATMNELVGWEPELIDEDCGVV